MTPKEETELLLRIVSQLARAQLETGGLMHFGAVLGPGRNVRVLMPEKMKENVTQDELHAYWERQLHAAAAEGSCKAIASCTFVEVPESDARLTTAVLIHIEHQETGAEDILMPYRRDEGKKVVFGASIRSWDAKNSR